MSFARKAFVITSGPAFYVLDWPPLRCLALIFVGFR